MTSPVAVSVVVPTIGRVKLLRACLESLFACVPAPAEILLVDQSQAADVSALAREYPRARLRRVESSRQGIAIALNIGLHSAQHETVLVTHDDCTVHSSWVGASWNAMLIDPRAIVTGRVLAVGDPQAVPSTKDDLLPRDFKGEAEFGVLYPNNMALNRTAVLELGGFDERFTSAAEDNDLCYRWLRAGRSLRYEPDLVVWHHDWRSPQELEETYVSYWRGQGQFYGKHVRAGDLALLSFVARDFSAAARATASALVRGRPRWTDRRRGVMRGLVPGLISGFVTFSSRPEAEESRPPA